MASTFSWRHDLRVVLAIGWSDFILKYRGSVLGYLWSFLGPLVQFIIIFYIFRPFVGGAVPHYHLYLFLGIIIWEHFATTTSACIGMLWEKQGMIQKVRFHRLILPLSVGWTHVIIACTRFVIFLMLAFAIGAPPGWSAGFFPVLLLQMSLLAVGVGMILSSYALRYRDIGHLWGIALQVLFWLTPVMYPAIAAEPAARAFLKLVTGGMPSVGVTIGSFVRLQPLSLILHDARRVFLYGDAVGMPTIGHAIGLTALCASIFLGGAWLFARRSRYFLEEY